MDADGTPVFMSSASADRTFRRVAAAISALYGAYVIATLADAQGTVLRLAFSAFVVPVPFLVWWAYCRAPGAMRRPVLLLAIAATLWLSGTLVWYAYYFAGGRSVPDTPGIWDGLFVPALILVIVAIVVALRSLISFRLAAFDVCILVAAGVTLAAPFIRQGLEHGVSAASLFTLNRPLLSIATLMLIVSAALGSWEGLPRSIALLGLGEIPLTVGNLVYSYAAVQGSYIETKWANLGWTLGGAIFALAAIVIILGIDRPVRLAPRAPIPNHPAGSRAALLLSLGALGLALSVATYGLLADAHGLTVVSLVASVSIGTAMTLRARDSIRTAERAYAQLDRSLAEVERARDQLTSANEDLGRANACIEALHIAYADLLNLADERTSGRLRELIEDTGDGLAALLEEELERGRRP